MNTHFSTRIIQQTLKCFPFFFAFFLIYSCDSRLENLKTKELKNNISILETSIDELNQKFDSLNLRIQQLEMRATDNDLVSEVKAEERTVNRQIVCPKCNGEGTKQETCGKCRGSGWSRNSRNLGCPYCGTGGLNNQGPGYNNNSCGVCYGKGRINEYE